MRILVAVDTQSYSTNIVGDVGKMAANTWADITILGVQPSATSPDTRWQEILLSFRKGVMDIVGTDYNPYAPADQETFQEVQPGAWVVEGEGKKRIRLCLRSGDSFGAIMEQSSMEDSDLIILGCSKGLDCEWEGDVGLPQKVAKKAACSVLVIKERKTPDQITAFLDQTNVSQYSLELLNQLVTLHGAGLKIVGLKGAKGTIGKEEVERKMVEILTYYNELQVGAWIRMVDMDRLEEYVAEATKEGIVAVWVGKKSILGKIFSTDMVGKLVSQTRSSVLILR